jgi:hypothetical protein
MRRRCDDEPCTGGRAGPDLQGRCASLLEVGTIAKDDGGIFSM